MVTFQPRVSGSKPPFGTGGARGDLQLSDLMNGLGESKRKLGPVRKALERLERKGVAVPAPLPSNVQVIANDTASTSGWSRSVFFCPRLSVEAGQMHQCHLLLSSAVLFSWLHTLCICPRCANCTCTAQLKIFEQNSGTDENRPLHSCRLAKSAKRRTTSRPRMSPSGRLWSR